MPENLIAKASFDLYRHIERLKPPNDAQLLMINGFLGDEAFRQLRTIGGEVYVCPKVFGIVFSGCDDGDFLQSHDTSFALNFLNRTAMFDCTTEYQYSGDEPLPENLLCPPLKTMWVDFMSTRYCLPVSLSGRFNDYADDSERMPEFMKKFANGIADFVGNRASLGQYLNGRGLMSDGVRYLRALHKIIASIDPQCEINLSPADEQRERIYRKAFRDCGNVSLNLD